MAPLTTFKSLETPSISKLKQIIDNWDALNLDRKDDPLPKLKEYLSNAKDGKVEVSYAHSGKAKISGRQFVRGGCGLQSFQKAIRHTIAGDAYRDYDIVNAHPVILNQYCEKNNIPHSYLSGYVKGRDAIIDILRMPRDDAKQLVLSMINGGTKEYQNVRDKPIWLHEFKDEIQAIHTAIAEKNAALVKAVKASKAFNVNGSVMNHILCDIENNILCSCVEFLALNGVSTQNIVLVFDGFMLPKGLEVDIDAMTTYAEQKTGYAVSMVEKPMTEAIDLSQFPQPADTAMVDSDSSAFDAVMAVHGSKLKRFNQKVYAFDESSGLWKTGSDAFGIFMKWSREVNGVTSWGTSCSKIHAAFGFSATLPSDEEYFQRAEEATLGKLLFRDVIWSIDGQSTLEFDPMYFFHARIDRTFPKTCCPSLKQRVCKILFDDPHPDSRVRHEFKKGLAVALTGRNPKRSLWFNLGGTGTGKSTLINSLKNAYGGYVDVLAAENLAIAKFGGTNDHCGWKLKFRNARIVLTSECSTNIKLDGNLLKSVSGGDPLAVRPIGCEAITINPQATLFSFANEFPAIDPVDEAMRDRLLAIRWGVKFAKGESRDESIGDFLKTPEACDALFYVLNDAYGLFLRDGFKDVPEITNFTSRLTNELDEFRQLFDSHFELGRQDDMLRTGDVYSVFREWSKSESRVANKLELDFGVTKESRRNKGVWEGPQRCFSGIKRIVNDDIVADF